MIELLNGARLSTSAESKHHGDTTKKCGPNKTTGGMTNLKALILALLLVQHYEKTAVTIKTYGCLTRKTLSG